MILYQKSIIRFFIKYKTEDDLKTFENLPCIKIIIIHASSSMQLSQIKFFHFFSFFFFKNDGNVQVVLFEIIGSSLSYTIQVQY